MGTGPVRCSECGETWPKNLTPVLKAKRGCPACSPDTFN